MQAEAMVVLVALLAAVGRSAGVALDEPKLGLTDPDDAPPPPRTAVSRPDDVWILGSHRLMCGDATSESDVRELLGDWRADWMWTDPPYGVKYDPGFNRSP